MDEDFYSRPWTARLSVSQEEFAELLSTADPGAPWAYLGLDLTPRQLSRRERLSTWWWGHRPRFHIGPCDHRDCY